MTLLLVAGFGVALALGAWGFLLYLQDRRYERETEQVFRLMRQHKEINEIGAKRGR